MRNSEKYYGQMWFLVAFDIDFSCHAY